MLKSRHATYLTNKDNRPAVYMLLSTSADVGDESVEWDDPENLSIAFRTACLSVVEREI